MHGDPLFPRRTRCQKGRTFAVLAALAALALAQVEPARAEGSRFDRYLAEEIPRLLEEHRQLGGFRLPILSPVELEALASGEPVVTLYREPATEPAEELHSMRVVGWHVVRAPRLLVWLAVLGGKKESSTRLRHFGLSRPPAGRDVSYHHVDLRWPFKDRHWLLLNEKNSSLANASHDIIWEHRWSLLPLDSALLELAYERVHSELALSRDALDAAVYLTANRGAFVLFDLGAGGALVATSMDVDFGGYLPDTLVRSFAKQQLKVFFDSLSASPGAHYTARPVIHDGRGVPITEEAALDTARNWADQLRLVTASTTHDSDRPAIYLED